MMSTGAAPKETLPFAPEEKQAVAKIASKALLVAWVLLLLGAIQIVGGPVAWLWQGARFISALLMLVQGALTLFLGLVMLAASSDFKFLGQTTKYAGNHFRNVAQNLTVFYKVQVALGLLIALVVIIRAVQ